MIRLERRDGGAAWILIDRPQARNAMTFEMWETLRELALKLDADSSVKAVVITGSSSAAFVAGTDIAAFRGFTSADGSAYEARMHAVISALEAIRVPVIAAIAGACTGGGVSIGAASDLRIGAPSARVGVPIARTLGNALSLANIVRVADIIGLDATKALIFGATLLDANEALRVGFLTEIAPSLETFQDYVTRAVGAIVQRAPLTLQITKEMCRRIRAARALPDDADLIRLAYGSDDFREGVDAFLKKRTPGYTGR